MKQMQDYYAQYQASMVAHAAAVGPYGSTTTSGYATTSDGSTEASGDTSAPESVSDALRPATETPVYGTDETYKATEQYYKQLAQYYANYYTSYYAQQAGVTTSSPAVAGDVPPSGIGAADGSGYGVAAVPGSHGLVGAPSPSKNKAAGRSAQPKKKSKKGK
eukprot:TRINITY_DN4766_c0_g1_i1.p1 TRINITY_DN4766_c0_g1~~TRINITY_DN4766_c0_g1_i1.p1  ORF type:complete len:162 (-),score=23.03 TRINITY_DN4766_c0_g1_i1:53-538(-)